MTNAELSIFYRLIDALEVSTELLLEAVDEMRSAGSGETLQKRFTARATNNHLLVKEAAKVYPGKR